LHSRKWKHTKSKPQVGPFPTFWHHSHPWRNTGTSYLDSQTSVPPSKNRKFSKNVRCLKNRCAAIFEAVLKLFGHASDPERECRPRETQVLSGQGHRENRPYVSRYISGRRQKLRIAISGLLISVGRGPQGYPLVQRASTLKNRVLVKFWFSDFARTPAIQFEPIYTYI